MSDMNIRINNIRNILSCDLDIPLEKGLYAIVGENGCGKSTLMLAMSLLVKPSSSKSFQRHDYKNDSFVDITVDDITDHWYVYNDELTTEARENHERFSTKNYYNGFYEGSIFFGSRFYDYNRVQNFMKKDDFESLIRGADSFVIKTLECVSKCIMAQIMQEVCECRPNGRRRGSARQACQSAWRHGGTP